MLGRLWNHPLVRKLICSILVLTALVSTLSWYFGVNSMNDLRAYVGMAMVCHPVWKDLALHRIHDGQSVDEVIEITSPIYVVRHGRFVEIEYQEPLSFTVVQMIAVDGSLVRACTGSCTWEYTFFDSLNEADAKEMSDSFDSDGRTVVYNGHPVVHDPANE